MERFSLIDFQQQVNIILDYLIFVSFAFKDYVCIHFNDPILVFSYISKSIIDKVKLRQQVVAGI